MNDVYEYANRKALGNFLFVGYSNVCPICYCSRDISSRDLPELVQNEIIYMNKNGKNYCFMKYIPQNIIICFN